MASDDARRGGCSSTRSSVYCWIPNLNFQVRCIIANYRQFDLKIDLVHLFICASVRCSETCCLCVSLLGSSQESWRFVVIGLGYSFSNSCIYRLGLMFSFKKMQGDFLVGK